MFFLHWYLTLSLVAAHDGGMKSVDARTVDGPTYDIQVTVNGVRRDYVRRAENATVADAVVSLPQGAIANLTKARMRIQRGRQFLDVDWRGIARLGDATTNYQLRTGDILLIELNDTGP